MDIIGFFEKQLGAFNMPSAKATKPKRGRPAKAATAKTKVKKASTTIKKSKATKAKTKKTKAGSGTSIIIQLQNDFNKSVDVTTKAISSELKNLSNQHDKLKNQVERLTNKQKVTREKKSAAAQKLAAKRTQGATNQLNRAKAAHKTLIGELKVLQQTLASSREQLKAAKVAEQKFSILVKLIAKDEKGEAPKITTPKKAKKYPLLEKNQRPTDLPPQRLRLR